MNGRWDPRPAGPVRAPVRPAYGVAAAAWGPRADWRLQVGDEQMVYEGDVIGLVFLGLLVAGGLLAAHKG